MLSILGAAISLASRGRARLVVGLAIGVVMARGEGVAFGDPAVLADRDNPRHKRFRFDPANKLEEDKRYIKHGVVYKPPSQYSFILSRNPNVPSVKRSPKEGEILQLVLSGAGREEIEPLLHKWQAVMTPKFLINVLQRKVRHHMLTLSINSDRVFPILKKSNFSSCKDLFLSFSRDPFAVHSIPQPGTSSKFAQKTKSQQKNKATAFTQGDICAIQRINDIELRYSFAVTRMFLKFLICVIILKCIF